MVDAGGQHTILLAHNPAGAITPVVKPSKVEQIEPCKSPVLEPMDIGAAGEQKINDVEMTEESSIQENKEDEDLEKTITEEKEIELTEKKPAFAEKTTAAAPLESEAEVPTVVPIENIASPSECPSSLIEASTAGATVNSSSMRSFSMASGSQ